MAQAVNVDVNDLVDAYKMQRNAAQDTIGILSAQVSGLSREIGKLTADNADKDTRIKALEDISTRKDERIEELEASVEALKNDLLATELADIAPIQPPAIEE